MYYRPGRLKVKTTAVAGLILTIAVALLVLGVPTNAAGTSLSLSANPGVIHEHGSTTITAVVQGGTPNSRYSVEIAVVAPPVRSGVVTTLVVILHTDAAGNGKVTVHFPRDFHKKANTDTPGTYWVFATLHVGYYVVTSQYATFKVKP